MRAWQSPAHGRWYGKDHLVFVPPYSRRGLYGQRRRRIGRMSRARCPHQGVELVAGHARPDPGHVCLRVPPP